MIWLGAVPYTTLVSPWPLLVLGIALLGCVAVSFLSDL